jgi:hypothetical protein
MSDKDNAHNDDFDFNTVTVKHRGKERTFEVHEIAAGKLDQLTAPLTHQDPAKRALAVEKYATSLIANSVTEGGTKISFDDAYSLPNSIAKRLLKEINKINGGGDADAEAEAAKNE